ncbi:hypothetical protein F4V43_06985 [Paenibacillus spiritus]|uniref:Uncharacterized protein n=2 Tax=Paenibacillus TaxID=44249 RepID=A0A5J5GDQ0_9BACL|nr:hypothetical protein F4V43_06985 [Paenibacillus spiritus]
MTPGGPPARVLTTSLGIALLANALMAAGAPEAGASSAAGEPKLVSYSTDEVKQYYDPNADWAIPYPEDRASETAEPTASPGVTSSGGTTVINNYGGYNSGFGWDDLLLYHFLFNSGGGYSPARYYGDRPTYYGGTRTAYKPKSYDSTKFQNKPVAGSVVKPKTSTSTTGSITRRGTSAGKGSVGGTSSGLGSSKSGSKSSSGSRSSVSSGSKSGGGLFGG